MGQRQCQFCSDDLARELRSPGGHNPFCPMLVEDAAAREAAAREYLVGWDLVGKYDPTAHAALTGETPRALGWAMRLTRGSSAQRPSLAA